MQDPEEVLMFPEIDFKKHYGQNFLINDTFAQTLVECASLTTDDTVIEIGPGIGTVSKFIIPQVKRYIGIEVDEELIELFKERFGSYSHVTLLNQNILEVELKDLNLKNYKVIGSLPYNISKKIIKKFLEADLRPTHASFLIQKEVAEDYAAAPPKAAFLSNYIQNFGTCTYIETVPASEFYPVPKVDGGIISIEYKQGSEVDDKFIQFLRNGFRNPRKKLINTLSAIFHVDKKELEEKFSRVGISQNARAQELYFDDWQKLYSLQEKTGIGS